jgi:predicted ATPase
MGVALDPARTGGLLVEREAALAALREGLTESRVGGGRVMLVSGEAGAGKTSLLRAFFPRCGAETRLFVGSCDPLSTPRPLGPLVDLAGAGALADVVRLGAPSFDIFDALQGELRQGPAVLAVEDLHWADEATLDTAAGDAWRPAAPSQPPRVRAGVGGTRCSGSCSGGSRLGLP